jgi:alpha-glucosidase
MLKLRQRLLPYLYTLFEECHRTGAPILRPLFWAYPDDGSTYSMDDEFLVGDALLVAPITRPGASYRHVYLPAGTWYHLWTQARIDGPAHVLAHAPLGRPATYVRANTAVPLGPEMSHVGEKAVDPLTFLLFPGAGHGSGSLYEDAGDGFDYLNGDYARRTVSCEMDGVKIQVEMGEQEGSFAPGRRHVRLELRGVESEPSAVLVGGSSAPFVYDLEQRRLIVDLSQARHRQLIDVL